MSNLNKFKDFYQVLETNSRFCCTRKEKFGTHKECVNNFLGPRFLSQTPYVLMCIKYMNVKRTKCPIAM